MTPIQRVLEALKKLETKYPQPVKPSDKPTYNDGAAAVIQELLKQIKPEIEAEKEMIIDSCFWGKVEACNYNDAVDYYNKLSK